MKYLTFIFDDNISWQDITDYTQEIKKYRLFTRAKDLTTTLKRKE